MIVVAGKGFCKGSFWGDHRSICAAKKGLAGVVIDGAFRDKEGCEEAGVPIFARCVVPGSAGIAAEKSTIQKMEETGEILPRIIKL